MLKWFALFPVLVFSASVASAQNVERARQLFQEASELREAGLYADAVARLRLAIAIKDTPGLEYHAGFCEAKLGHYRSAIQYYEKAAALLRKGATAPDVVALLPPAHTAALEHIARIRLHLGNSASTVQLTLDEEPAQSVPEGDLLVDPGKHRLVLVSRGHNTETREVVVSEAEILNLQVDLTPVTRAEARMQTSKVNPFPWKTASLGIGLGVTAAGITVGIVSSVKRSDAQDQINFYHGIYGLEATNAEITKASDKKSSATRWETIGFVSAGVGAAATAALWALWPTSENVRVSVLSGWPEKGPSTLFVTADF